MASQVSAKWVAKSEALWQAWGIRATGVHDELVGEVRPLLLSLFGTVRPAVTDHCVGGANPLDRLAAVRGRSARLAVLAAAGIAFTAGTGGQRDTGVADDAVAPVVAVLTAE